MTALDPVLVAGLRDATGLLRKGKTAEARANAEALLAAHPGAAVAEAFLGMLCCRTGDLAAGIAHLAAAHRNEPEDMTTLANLVTALIANGDIADAESLCRADLAARDPSLRLWRLRGWLSQQFDDISGAIAAYEAVTSAAPDDFESWNNLGNAQVAAGAFADGIVALERAVKIQPGIAAIRINLGAALVDAARLDEALVVMNACARDFPADPKPLAELGVVLAKLGREHDAIEHLSRAVQLDAGDAHLRVKLGQQQMVVSAHSAAEESFRSALSISPGDVEAHVQLAILYEQTNRPSEFNGLIVSAQANGVSEEALQFIRALAHRRARRFAEGLAAIASVPDHREPVRRAQMIGEFQDRLGNADAAFAAFAEMNRLSTLDPTDPLRRAAEFRSALAEDRKIVTPQWYAGWRRAPPPERPSPVFLVGFPRSGTTLLDTMLMGHPDVEVLEERPPLRHVERGLDRLASLSTIADDKLDDARALFFEEAERFVPLRPDTLLVDKFPMHLNKVPLIHRLFPDARFILALRHPCDVVLSCFITSFRLNNAMVNFLELGSTAATYDQTFGYWEQCRAIMPLRVHTVYYEDMIADVEAELRPLFAYLGLDWRAEALDHKRTAAARGAIGTASYAQVTEALYDRANGRWRRYAKHLEPIMPLLTPWIDRFGYKA